MISSNSPNESHFPLLYSKVSSYSEKESIFSLPVCSGKISLIALVLIGIISLVLGILAVVFFGFSQPGTILGIVFISIGIALLMFVCVSFNKRTLINKANTLFRSKTQDIERLKDKLIKTNEEALEKNQETFEQLLEVLKELKKTLTRDQIKILEDLIDFKEFLLEIRDKHRLSEERLVSMAITSLRAQHEELVEEMLRQFSVSRNDIRSDMRRILPIFCQEIAACKSLIKVIARDSHFVRASVVEGLVSNTSLAQLRVFDCSDESSDSECNYEKIEETVESAQVPLEDKKIGEDS